MPPSPPFRTDNPSWRPADFLRAETKEEGRRRDGFRSSGCLLKSLQSMTFLRRSTGVSMESKLFWLWGSTPIKQNFWIDMTYHPLTVTLPQSLIVCCIKWDLFHIIVANVNLATYKLLWRFSRFENDFVRNWLTENWLRLTDRGDKRGGAINNVANWADFCSWMWNWRLAG